MPEDIIRRKIHRRRIEVSQFIGDRCGIDVHPQVTIA
jgi:hypothetical protein